MTATRKTTTAFAMVVALLVVAIAYLVAREPVQANHTPADKVSGGSSEIVKVPIGPVVGAGTDANNIIGPVTVRSSKPSDMILAVTLECSILTEVTSNTAATSATAEGLIRVWVVIDNVVVPITTTSTSPPQNPPAAGNDSDKVTFCNRVHRLSQTDAEAENGAVDTTTSFIETKEANAFNWLRFNMGSGIHEIKVRADLDTSTVNTATASGYVGNRTLIGQPAKLANDASFTSAP